MAAIWTLSRFPILAWDLVHPCLPCFGVPVQTGATTAKLHQLSQPVTSPRSPNKARLRSILDQISKVVCTATRTFGTSTWKDVTYRLAPDCLCTTNKGNDLSNRHHLLVQLEPGYTGIERPTPLFQTLIRHFLHLYGYRYSKLKRTRTVG
ncbi:hypothetical protein FALCPG4_004741 [Fusarium falciforme]